MTSFNFSGDLHAEPAPQPKTGLAILYQPEGCEAEVDVIAIHGIGADPDRTWETKGVNWLKDKEMLPSAAGKSRIMRFGWASEWMGKDSIHQHSSKVADQLLDSLRTMRSTSPQRPMVFVCHCFGGIVLLKAIITARLDPPRRFLPSAKADDHSKSVLDCVAGILFLGTPFTTSKAQTYAKLIGNIYACFGIGNSQIYDMSDHEMSELRHWFVRIVNDQSIPVFFFFEQEKSNIGSIINSPMPYNILVIDKDLATIEGYDCLGLAANHFNMHKYPSPQDANYIRVLPQLKDMIEKAPNRVKARLNPQPLIKGAKDLESSRLLPALCSANPLEDRLKFQKQIPEDFPETYSWVSADGMYTKWLNEDKDAILWIYGEDGKGKTALMISIIDALTNKVQRSSQRRALAFFFAEARDSNRNTTAAILRVLLYQILIQQPDALEPWQRAYGEFEENLFEKANCLRMFWEVLQNVLAKAKLDVAYFILYRPELCGMSIWDELRDFSESIFNTKCRIKWVVITRIQPCDAKCIDISLSIDLAKASPDGLPNSIDTPSSGPILQSSSSEQYQPISDPSGSPPELEMPPPAQELLDSVSVYCSRLKEIFWTCKVQTYREMPSEDFYIISKRTDGKGVIRHLMPQGPLPLIPHTETGIDADHRYAVLFLEDHQVILQNLSGQMSLSARLEYRLNNEEDFFTFQRLIHGQLLKLLCNVSSIESHKGRVSLGQDLRLWSAGDDVTLMFLTNCRKRKEYFRAPSVSFKPLNDQSKRPDTLTAILEFTDAGMQTFSPRRSFLSINTSRSEGYLEIKFVRYDDKREFLKHWPGGFSPSR